MIFDFFSIPIKPASSSCLLMSLYIREQSIGQETKLFESGVPEIPWDGGRPRWTSKKKKRKMMGDDRIKTCGSPGHGRQCIHQIIDDEESTTKKVSEAVLIKLEVAEPPAGSGQPTMSCHIVRAIHGVP
jgi:hypothetical protein